MRVDATSWRLVKIRIDHHIRSRCVFAGKRSISREAERGRLGFQAERHNRSEQLICFYLFQSRKDGACS
jgi:hypothetical protein